MTTVSFAVLGKPVAWARPRKRKHGGYYTQANHSAAKEAIGLIARRAMDGGPPMDGPLFLRCYFVYPWPKSYSLKKRADLMSRWKTTRPDKDNLEKLVMDALNGIVWHDDSQVCDGRVSKYFGDNARTTVVVDTIEGHPHD